MKCKDCSIFRRSSWNDDNTAQAGGECDLLLLILKMNNSSLVFVNTLYVQDEFGCVMGKEKINDS